MKVLIACEYSGVVRDAFRALGHDAVSCDLLPTDKPGPHIKGDVHKVIGAGWDLMIAHPPCTYLSYAGNRWFNVERYGAKAIKRMEDRETAISFFLTLRDAPIDKIAIENPIGYLNKTYKPTQIIQPYYFGDNHIKAACLWLKGLPKLVPTNILPKPEPLCTTIRKPSKYCKGGEVKKHYFSCGGVIRDGHRRSVTFQGVANAMAQQWGGII